MQIRTLTRSNFCKKPYLLAVGLLLILCIQVGCATTAHESACPSNTLNLPDCAPDSAIQDSEIDRIYEYRTWVSPDQLDEDPIAFGVNYDLPVHGARGKILGPDDEGAIGSLAAKLWMIENAEHSIDFGYYIFMDDIIGYAMVGAMCDAVKRGVDVRVLVDSLGSMKAGRTLLAALKTCESEAGFIPTADGKSSTRKARVQVVVFNAITRISTSPNRRSHDKLLLIDADFHDKAVMMTGGRNISLDYYGITEDGEYDPYSYRDSEIILRPAQKENEQTIGEISAGYFTLLYLYKGNRYITDVSNKQTLPVYRKELEKAYSSLNALKQYDLLKPHLQAMPLFMHEGFHASDVLLAFNLANITNKRVSSNAVENLAENPNSIIYILNQITEHDDGKGTTRIVSPYLFLAQYKDKDGNILVDEALEMRKWLDKHPDSKIEIISNSVLTSDNFSTQSIIDMDTAPRLLLDDETRAAWLALKADDEANGELTSSESWLKQVNHPRLAIYETGKLDSIKLGDGDAHYAKLHAKFFVDQNVGFVGTTNFDYRSRLYNSEMGYFFSGDELSDELDKAFEDLVGLCYRWGSPEWLELRTKTIDAKGTKGWSTRHQRKVFKTLKATGLHWLF